MEIIADVHLIPPAAHGYRYQHRLDLVDSIYTWYHQSPCKFSTMASICNSVNNPKHVFHTQITFNVS